MAKLKDVRVSDLEIGNILRMVRPDGVGFVVAEPTRTPANRKTWLRKLERSAQRCKGK